MAPGDVCHCPRCSSAGLGRAALGYRPYCWPGTSAWSPQCPGPTSPLFTHVPAWSVVLRSRCPVPLGSCLPLRSLGALCCMCGVLGHLAPVHRCARPRCCVVCAVSWATWLLSTGVPARCGVLHVRCPGPLGSCSPVCPPEVLCCVFGLLGYLAPVHRCVRSVRCVAWTPPPNNPPSTSSKRTPNGGSSTGHTESSWRPRPIPRKWTRKTPHGASSDSSKPPPSQAAKAPPGKPSTQHSTGLKAPPKAWTHRNPQRPGSGRPRP